MANIQTVESEIAAFEQFKVQIRHGLGGRDVRGDRRKVPGYSGRYKRIARNGFSVADWIKKRFAKHYPGFKVTVLQPDGKAAHGRMKLRALRQQYLRHTS